MSADDHISRADVASPQLLELLACPLTKSPLRYDRERQELVSEKANLAFPIRHGVPIMTVEAARSLDEPPPRRE